MRFLRVFYTYLVEHKEGKVAFRCWIDRRGNYLLPNTNESIAIADTT